MNSNDINEAYIYFARRNFRLNPRLETMSDRFYTRHNSRHEGWRIWLDPKAWFNSKDPADVGILLIADYLFDVSTVAQCRITLRSSREILFIGTFENDYSCTKRAGFKTCFRLDAATLPDATLYVGCYLKLSRTPRTTSPIYRLNRVPSVPSTSLTIRNFKSLFDDPVTSNIEFVVGDRSIFVHTGILRFRSSYFAEMFDSGFDEDFNPHKRKPVRSAYIVPMTTYEGFRALLFHLYTDQSEFPDVDPAELFILADKYDAPRLRKVALDAVIRTTDVQNVGPRLFQWAHTFYELVFEMIGFVVAHFDEVRVSKEWAEAMDRVMKDILDMVMQEMQKMIDEEEAYETGRFSGE